MLHVLTYYQHLVRVAGIEPACPCEREILSLLCLPISPHSQLFGVPPGTRTPTNGFGDRYAAITLGIHILAEVVGFEPTDPFEPSVFKTAALSHAQPYFLNLVAEDGFEPPTSRL